MSLADKRGKMRHATEIQKTTTCRVEVESAFQHGRKTARERACADDGDQDQTTETCPPCLV